MPVILGLLVIPPLYYIIRYRASIKHRIEEIEKAASNFRVYREKSVKYTNNARTEELEQSRQIKCLELHPAFVEEHKDEWSLMSLGQYLSQLRPLGNDVPKFLKKELEIGIGNFLLNYLGKTYGAALLPAFGLGSVDSALSSLAVEISAWATAKILSDDTEKDDIGIFAISLPELISMINMNQTFNSSSEFDIKMTPLNLFQKGEVGYGNLSFHNEEKYDGGFTSPFVMERDFKKVIADMEELTRSVNGAYDPDDKSLPEPTPIDERILPDLYFGWGNAKCTHTKRECLENRLVALLLTKLSYNFYKKANDGDDHLFEVHWNNKICRYPEELIQEFMNNGHIVEICPRSTVACFGVALCVKENDGQYSNIPITVQLRTGIERSSDGKPAYFQPPHGGLDIGIKGPLIGETKMCEVQFYVSLDGLTGFYANHDVDLPFLKRTSLADVYPNEQAISAVRMAGLVAVVFNRIATEMNLPFGGYGVLGMCNDVATLIDYAIRGKASAYPLLSTGRYLNHIMAYFLKLKESLNQCESMDSAVVDDIDKLIRATCNMPNDLHISPSTLVSCYERFNATYSKTIFQATEDSKDVIKEMVLVYKQYIDKKEEAME